VASQPQKVYAAQALTSLCCFKFDLEESGCQLANFLFSGGRFGEKSETYVSWKYIKSIHALSVYIVLSMHYD
jgi:hypothetical protein